MTIGLETAAGNVDDAEYRFLISGASLKQSSTENPATNWITKRMWTEIQYSEGIPVYKGFAETVAGDIDAWKAYFDGPTPQNETMPGKWDKALNPLQKLGILRCFRPDKVILGIQSYIASTMGQKYIEPPPFDLPLSFLSSTTTAPMIFILSVGTDPMKVFQEFAAEKKMAKKILCFIFRTRTRTKSREINGKCTKQRGMDIVAKCPFVYQLVTNIGTTM